MDTNRRSGNGSTKKMNTPALLLAERSVDVQQTSIDHSAKIVTFAFCKKQLHS